MLYSQIIMRDSMKPCDHTLSDDAIYKDVVVIGNGPSGMVTSFLLAGNAPHLKDIPGELPIDEMLRARLSNLIPGQSLYDADLLELAEGLEGRSQNPISLLMDNLLRPCADLGMQADSLVEWRYDVEKEVEHVVLGSGPPGGSWHTFPPNVLTLSPGAWLSLPPHATHAAERRTASAVAEYCRRYVQACHLQRYFRTGVVVTSVTAAPRSPGAPCNPACPRGAAYCVSGYDHKEQRGFRYVCRRVVVAAGACDRPNALPQHISTHAVHQLADLERAAQLLDTKKTSEHERSVLIVGSGVSAADAVRLARSSHLHVYHLHRTAADSLAKLPLLNYPDYNQVYKMMCDGPTGNHPNYNSLPEHMIVEVSATHSPRLRPSDDDSIRLKKVKLLNLVTNSTVELSVSVVAVLIGSKPDLFFLQTNFNLNTIDIKKCSCNEKKMDDKQCFLRNHWHYFKSVLGQSIQSCKSRYLSYTEINGNVASKCAAPACSQRRPCSCSGDAERGLPYAQVQDRSCHCQPTNPYSSGLGYGVDPKKPVDGRSNPVAIDKGTHELLNSPGMYALGPLTADNFIRFIPGGALALVSHIHREIKSD